jgi:hypothetical protein
MFVESVEKAQVYTKSIHTIIRNFGSNVIQPANSTLFFVNSDGWAITCSHVVDCLLSESALDKRNEDYKNELATKPQKMQQGQWKNQLAKKYNLNKEATWELRNQLMDIGASSQINYTFIKHSKYDVALLKINSPLNPTINSFPIFPKDGEILKIGKSLCRLGYPFPEFNNYQIDAQQDKIMWTLNGNNSSPFFANDGIVTRLVSDNGIIYAFEMSTPGIKGQSGGPIFDNNGLIWGIQFQTAFFDLDFDVTDFKVYRNGIEKKISAHSMLNVGRAIHVQVIKDLMDANGVSYQKQA